MLTQIKARDIEPMAQLAVELAPRLNLLTGDNGLGKTLLLDLAWWGATGSWAHQRVSPRRGRDLSPEMVVNFSSDKVPEVSASFDYREYVWNRHHMFDDAIVLYAQADGGFDVWDPLRESGPWHLPLGNQGFRPSKHFRLNPSQVWDGLKAQDGIPLCNGLLHDWDTWRFQKPELFQLFSRVLATLSPHPNESLRPGPSRRVSLEDVRDIPTLLLSYGEVPVTVASSAMRRVLAMAYMLLWTWSEHCTAAGLRNLPPHQDMLFLIDEIDAHLHPWWQRVILPALFEVFPQIASSLRVQVMASTHAPLVLASVESLFDEQQDQLLHFGLRDGAIQVERLPWSKQGDAVNWLVSESFGLEQARSREAERAIEAAERFMRDEDNPPELSTQEQIHEALVKVLPGHDPFWPRWLVDTRQLGDSVGEAGADKSGGSE